MRPHPGNSKVYLIILSSKTTCVNRTSKLRKNAGIHEENKFFLHLFLILNAVVDGEAVNQQICEH